jgi:hypothetical protein
MLIPLAQQTPTCRVASCGTPENMSPALAGARHVKLRSRSPRCTVLGWSRTAGFRALHRPRSHRIGFWALLCGGASALAAQRRAQDELCTGGRAHCVRRAWVKNCSYEKPSWKGKCAKEYSGTSRGLRLAMGQRHGTSEAGEPYAYWGDSRSRRGDSGALPQELRHVHPASNGLKRNWLVSSA